MLESGIELIQLSDNTNYAPTFISTDKRVPAGTPTTLGYWQIGETQQYGFAKGPIFKVDFLEIVTGEGSSATHVKIWGIDNKDDAAPLFPINYLSANPTVHVYLQKFLICDENGDAQSVESYNIIGYKKKGMLISW